MDGHASLVKVPGARNTAYTARRKERLRSFGSEIDAFQQRALDQLDVASGGSGD